MPLGFGTPQVTPRRGPGGGPSDSDEEQGAGDRGGEGLRHAIDSGRFAVIETRNDTFRGGAMSHDASGQGSTIIINALSPKEIERMEPSQECLKNLILQHVQTKEEAEKVLKYLLKKFPDSDNDKLAEYKAHVNGQTSRGVSATRTAPRHTSHTNAQNARTLHSPTIQSPAGSHSEGPSWDGHGRGYTLGGSSNR